MPETSLISIVDDDQSFRDSMRRLLKSHGYTVAVFPSAAEFLASTQLPATACLVADMHMPAMTGAELYQHLVATGHAIPTILITAHPEEGVRQRMLSLGVGCLPSQAIGRGRPDRLPSSRLRARQGASSRAMNALDGGVDNGSAEVLWEDAERVFCRLQARRCPG